MIEMRRFVCDCSAFSSKKNTYLNIVLSFNSNFVLILGSYWNVVARKNIF